MKIAPYTQLNRQKITKTYQLRNRQRHVFLTQSPGNDKNPHKRVGSEPTAELVSGRSELQKGEQRTRYISRTTQGTPNRYPTVNKVLWTFQATHNRNNRFHNYTCSEESIEAHISTLVDCCSGWTNEGEQPYLTGKYVIQHSIQTDRKNSGKGKIRNRRTDIVPHARGGAELKIHFPWIFILYGNYRSNGRDRDSDRFVP